MPLEDNGGFFPVHIRFSPDGRRILAVFSRGSGPEMWLLPFPDGAAAHGRGQRILTASLTGAEIPDVNWMPDNRRIVMDFSNVGHPQTQLWMADTRNETMEPITADEGRKTSPAVSPDGRQIAFESSRVDFDIVEIPLAGGPVRPLLATSRNEQFPEWSPKGSAYAYVTDRSGRREIWMKSTVEGWERPLVTARDFPDDETIWLMTLAFSPDGSRIAYARVSNRHLGEIWMSTVSGGTPIPRTFHSQRCR